MIRRFRLGLGTIQLSNMVGPGLLIGSLTWSAASPGQPGVGDQLSFISSICFAFVGKGSAGKTLSTPINPLSYFTIIQILKTHNNEAFEKGVNRWCLLPLL